MWYDDFSSFDSKEATDPASRFSSGRVFQSDGALISKAPFPLVFTWISATVNSLKCLGTRAGFGFTSCHTGGAEVVVWNDCVERNVVNHANRVHVCVFVCAPPPPPPPPLPCRQPPARPSSGCRRACASSSETPSPRRALWRSRPRRSYQVQRQDPASWEEVTLTRTESFSNRGPPSPNHIPTHRCPVSQRTAVIRSLPVWLVRFFFEIRNHISVEAPKTVLVVLVSCKVHETRLRQKDRNVLQPCGDC